MLLYSPVKGLLLRLLLCSLIWLLAEKVCQASDRGHPYSPKTLRDNPTIWWSLSEVKLTRRNLPTHGTAASKLPTHVVNAFVYNIYQIFPKKQVLTIFFRKKMIFISKAHFTTTKTVPNLKIFDKNFQIIYRWVEFTVVKLVNNFLTSLNCNFLFVLDASAVATLLVILFTNFFKRLITP